jgi:hypothetical protein
MDTQNFQYATLYTYKIDSEQWQVAVYDGPASQYQFPITVGCICSIQVDVHPYPGQTLTVVIVGPDQKIYVTEVSLAALPTP